jgi:arginine repressor
MTRPDDYNAIEDIVKLLTDDDFEITSTQESRVVKELDSVLDQ